MKKIINKIRYVGYCILSGVLFIGCETEGGNPQQPNVADQFKEISLSISASKTAHFINDIVEITLIASADVPQKLTVTIESDLPSVLVPTSNYVVIAEGEKEAKFTLNCLSKGTAKVKITSTLIEAYGTQEIVFNVKEEVVTPPDPVYKTPDIGILKSNRTISPTSEEKYSNIFYFKYLNVEEFFEYWGFTGTTEYSERDGAGYVVAGSGYKTMIIPYQGELKGDIIAFGGNFVGEVIDGEPFFKPVSEGAEIDENLDWVGAVNQGNYFLNMFIRDTPNTSKLPDGEHFIVLFMAQEGPADKVGRVFPSSPAWLKIKVEGMTLTILDGAIRIADVESFKVGQKTL